MNCSSSVNSSAMFNYKDTFIYFNQYLIILISIFYLYWYCIIWWKDISSLKKNQVHYSQNLIMLGCSSTESLQGWWGKGCCSLTFRPNFSWAQACLCPAAACEKWLHFPCSVCNSESWTEHGREEQKYAQRPEYTEGKITVYALNLKKVVL